MLNIQYSIKSPYTLVSRQPSDTYFRIGLQPSINHYALLIKRMPIVRSLKAYLANRVIRSVRETDPEVAYDIWSKEYDQQPDNLMLALDEQIFTALSNQTSITGKMLADIGCGTGRHWKFLLDKRPKSLAGYDVSRGMLEKLKQKFPEAETHRLERDLLPDIDSSSIDLLISTLTVAHIENIGEAFTEWNRVVKPGGNLIITDYHPQALAKGGKRTFKQGQTLFAVRNYIHTLQHIREIADVLNWELVQFIEKRIDESMRPYYSKQGAEKIFENFKGVPIIYGMLLKKKNAIT